MTNAGEFYPAFASRSTTIATRANTPVGISIALGRLERSIVLIMGFTIALAIHSLDLRWSENHSTKEHFLKASHRAKNECYLMKELFRQE